MPKANRAATERGNSATIKKKPSSAKPIKYVDKSPGQPQLSIVFDNIKALMKLYEKGTIKERGEKPGAYGLVSEKQVEAAGRKLDEMYFAGIIVQKGYVGFYYMPVYLIEEVKEQLKPELLKCLKGKSCFYIRKNDPIIIDQIKEALEIGYDSYKKRGWA